MKITIRAKSSAADPYEVDFVVEDSRISAFCNCQAGSFGKLCKHKTELLSGETSRLFDDSERSKLVELQEIVNKAPEILQLTSDIASSEKLIRTERARLKKMKKNLEAGLKQGIPLESS